jgi:hypothetical protein
MHDESSPTHEFAFEEHESLVALEAVHTELCSRRETFWAQREGFPLGYSAYVLAELLSDLTRFSGRLAHFSSAANQLKAAQHGALEQRLSEVRADLQRTISLIQEMHEDRVASERRALGIATKSDKGVLDTLGIVSRGLRHVLGMDKTGE